MNVNDDPYLYNGFPMNTPMDVRLGLTKEDGIHHKLRWGIISASSISSDWVKSLQDVPGAQFAAIAARDMDRARAFADAHEIPTAYDSYQALCEDPDVDIVYIASKTWDHHRDLKMAIAAGKHVLCEKPFTDTADQAKEVFEAADKAGIVCWEGMWLRFFPAVEHARAAMERGDIGYPVPTPAPITRGQPPGSRWNGERMITYKGWTWHGGNQHGFTYQAQAVHRCMAAGLKELPQWTTAESIRVSEIIDEINRQCAERGF